jgi:WD40 repeat protein
MRTLAGCLLLSCVTLAPAAAPPACDADPTPRLRLGTSRWRLNNSAWDRLPWVLSDDRAVLARRDGNAVSLFDVRTGRRLHQLADEAKLAFDPLAFSHDGKRLAMAGSDKALWFWEPASGRRTRWQRPSFTVYHAAARAAFLPGDRQVATWNGEHLAVWEFGTGKQLREDRLNVDDSTPDRGNDGERIPLRDVASFSPDGRRFACVMGGEVLVLAELTTGRWCRVRLPWKKDSGARFAWSWSADSRQIAVSFQEGGVQVHDAATGRLVRKLRGRTAAFAPDGRSLAVLRGGAVEVDDLATGKLLHRIEAERFSPSLIQALAYRDADHLLAIDSSYFVRTWRLSAGKELGGPGHRDASNGLAFMADGRALISVGRDGRLIRWDVRTGRQLGEVKAQTGKWLWSRCRAVSLSRDGDVAGLLSVNSLGGAADVSLLDVRRGRIAWHEGGWPLPRSYGWGGGMASPKTEHACEVSPDGSLVALPTRTEAILSYSNWVEVRRADGRRLWTFATCLDPNQTFSPDSRELALVAEARDRPVVRLIDVQAGKLSRTFQAGTRQEGTITALSFSPEGRLVVAADERCLYLWDRDTGQGIDRIALPEGLSVTKAVVTRAGRVLVVGSFRPMRKAPGGHGVVVWDSWSRRVLLSVSPGAGPFALCGDGRTLAVGCDDSSILLYDLPQPQAETTRLDETEQRRLWADLSSPDARRAWRARLRLATAPKDAVALMREHLRPAPAKAPVDLADLDAEDFDRREAATKRLAESLRRGDRAAELALRELSERPPSLESHHRARRLLAGCHPIPFKAEEHRILRAVGVLEQIGDADAKALLERLSKGGPSLLASQARAALARLNVR